MSEKQAESNGIDVVSLKNEIIESSKSVMTDLLGDFKDAVLGQVNKTLETHTENLKNNRTENYSNVTNEALSDLKEELDGLGVDESQGLAMVRLVEKLMNKKTANFKQEVLTEVDQTINSKDFAKEITTETMRMFPDIKNKKSDLFLKAKTILNGMSDYSRKAPEAEATAVKLAALELGIKPRTIRDINAYDGQSNMGEGGGNFSKDNQKEINADTATLFNVDLKKVNEILKNKGL